MITSNGGVVVIVIGECGGDEWRWDWIEEWWSDENRVWELWKEIMKSREWREESEKEWEESEEEDGFVFVSRDGLLSIRLVRKRIVREFVKKIGHYAASLFLFFFLPHRFSQKETLII
jgi:hypothetical protein